MRIRSAMPGGGSQHDSGTRASASRLQPRLLPRFARARPTRSGELVGGISVGGLELAARKDPGPGERTAVRALDQEDLRSGSRVTHDHDGRGDRDAGIGTVFGPAWT